MCIWHVGNMLKIRPQRSNHRHLSACLLSPKITYGVEEKSVKSLKSGNDGFLHVGVCCKSLLSQVIRKGSKEMEITDHKIGTVGRMVPNLLTRAPETVPMTVTGPVLSSSLYTLRSTWMASGLHLAPT